MIYSEVRRAWIFQNSRSAIIQPQGGASFQVTQILLPRLSRNQLQNYNEQGRPGI